MDVDFSVASSGPASVGPTSTMLGGSGSEFQALLSTPPMVTGHAGVAATTLLSPHAPSPPPLSNLFGLIIPGFPVRTDFVPADVTGTKFTMQWQVPMGSPNSALSHGGGGDHNHHRQLQQQQQQPLSSVNEVVAFLLPNVPLPPNHGVLFFWQISVVGGLSSSHPQQPLSDHTTTATRTTGFALLGALTPHHQPSNVFRTGWSEHEDVLEMERSVVMALSSSQQQQLPQQQPQLVVTFGVSLESLDNIQNLPTSGTNHNNERRLFVAQQIATDLFQFMQSFDTSSSSTGLSNANSSMMVVPTNIFDRWMKRFEARFRRDPNFFLKPSQS